MITFVVHGATGYVGRHLVRGLLAADATVIAVGRSGEQLTALTEAVSADPTRLVCVVADVSTDDGARWVAERLRDHAPFDGAFAAIGGWWEGPRLVDLDTAIWSSLLDSHLTAHFHALRATAPLLSGDASAYVTFNGIATLQPEAGSGPVSVTGAAQTMLLDVVRVEDTRPGVRYHELCVVNPVVDDGQAPYADEAVVEISAVVAEALALARTGKPDEHRREIGVL